MEKMASSTSRKYQTKEDGLQKSQGTSIRKKTKLSSSQPPITEFHSDLARTDALYQRLLHHWIQERTI